MPTAVVLLLGGVGVSGLVVGGRVSELGSGGGLGLVLADDGGDRGLPGLAVRELQQVGIVGGHGAASKQARPRRLEKAALLPPAAGSIGGLACSFADDGGERRRGALRL